MAHPGRSPVSDPWPWPVNVDQIPETGLRVAFEATDVQRAAMAKVAGLRDVGGQPRHSNYPTSAAARCMSWAG